MTLEARKRYVVTQELTAYRLQSSEGFAPDPHQFRVNYVLFADLEIMKGQKWEGELDPVKFTIGTSTYFYVNRAVFLASTRHEPAQAVRFN